MTLPHCCRHPSIMLALNLCLRLLPDPYSYVSLPSEAETHSAVDRWCNCQNDPLRSFAFPLFCQIYNSGLLYILLKYEKMRRSYRTSFPFCFADLEDPPATTTAFALPFPTTKSVYAFVLAFAALTFAFSSAFCSFPLKPHFPLHQKSSIRYLSLGHLLTASPRSILARIVNLMTSFSISVV